MQLRCPKCQRVNRLNVKENIRCGACNDYFVDSIYEKSNDLSKYAKTGIVVACLVGGVAGSYLDDLFEKNRYPIQTEFQSIYHCATPNSSRLNFDRYVDICSCALEIAMKKMPFDSFEEQKFITLFNDSLNYCSKR